MAGILRQMRHAFVVLDGGGRFLLWNSAFEDLTGYTRQELAVVQPADLFVEDAAAEVSALGETSEPGRQLVRVTRWRSRAGLEIPVELRTVELNSPDGEPLQLILIE